MMDREQGIIKINYQKETEKILTDIKQNGRKPKLVLQSCCGPCSSYVLQYLTDYFDVYVYYYNPNIFPQQEYLHRLNTQKQLIECLPHENKIELLPTEYNHDEFLKASKGLEHEKEGGARCEKCFLLRLEETAKKARQLGADYFGTTLTVSPHKNAQTINLLGKNLQDKYGVKFLYSDFKKKAGYKQSIELSAEYGLYRQDYCGCEFSLDNAYKQQ